MRTLSAWICGVLVLAFAVPSTAQESVVQETNAPSVKWYQVNTPHFKILYPKGFETQAQRMANTLEHIHAPEAASMGVRPKKIPLILQNQSAVSNGFVTLAPRRSEFFTMPSQDYNFTGNNDWLNMLASHEYRHVVQFQRSIVGFNKFVYHAFGQQALALTSFIAAPQWFWEGDAVATETAFTHSGRGRIPNFDLMFRTNLLEGRSFHYDKQYLRSYKHNIPNHYLLGYHMISYLRKKTGDADVWEKVARRSWSVPFIPFRFSSSIHKNSGLYVKDLYTEMAANLISQWKTELSTLPLTSFETVNHRTSTAYADYQYPQVLNDTSVLVQKLGIGDIDQLTMLTPQGEKKVFVQGFLNYTGMLSSANGRVVWNEYRYDPRWLVRTYSVVVGLDLKTGKKTQITSQSRYAGAALSPDGTKIATIETGTDYQTRLVILDYSTGDVITALPNPDNNFISMPHWSEDGRSVIALRSIKSEKTISRFDVATGAVQDLVERRIENYGYPVPYGKYLFYNSPYSGIDNIYAVNTESGAKYQVTCSKLAAYNAAVSHDGKTIYYNEQTRDGLNVVRIPFDPGTWRPIDQIKIAPGFFEHLVQQEGRPGLLDSIPTTTYDAKRYHRASGMINPHSWGPYYTNTLAQAQAGIISSDVLSTTTINAGYQYDINEKTGSVQGGISYQGFYPAIDAQVYAGNREYKTTIGSNQVKLNWQETGSSLGLRVPLLLSRSKYYSSLEIGNSVGVTQISSFEKSVTNAAGTVVDDKPDRYVPVTLSVNNTPTPLYYLITERAGSGSLYTNTFKVSWAHYLKQSRRDFNPKFGQYLAFEHYSTPYGGDFNGQLWVARALAFFPGVFKHHSLFFRGGYQSSLSNDVNNGYTFRNQLFKPRGFSYPTDNTFSSILSNYQLPLWYPDIALGPVLNIQRVKANFFYDYGRGEGKDYFYDFVNQKVYTGSGVSNYISGGVELTFDVNVLRILQQIEVGVRATYLNANATNKGGMVFEFLIGNIPF